MKHLKSIILSVALGSLLVFNATSCTDLDETLYSQLNESNIDLTNENDLSLLLGASTAQYRYLVADWFGMFHLLEESGDQYMVPARVGVGWGDAYINLHKHNWGVNVDQIYNPWQLAYRGIGYANQVIDALGEPTEEKAKESMAHARFFRAMFYYHLLDMYGNAPLQTTQIVPDGYLPEQCSEDFNKGCEGLFNFCVSEFKYVKNNIGDTKYFGYGNKYAAAMALAKLYLNRQVYVPNTTDDKYKEYLDSCLAECEFIDGGGYTIDNVDYQDNFKESIEDCPEVIFAVPCDRTHTAQFGLQSYCFPQTGLLAYGTAKCSTAAGYNGSCAIPQWVRTYNEDDKRLDYTWAHGLQTYAADYGDHKKGEPIEFSTHDWKGEGYLNYNINVHSIDNPGAFQQEGYRLHKYQIVADDKNTDKGTTATDIVIFRYADVKMMKAECYLRLGSSHDDDALALINAVRDRCFVNKKAALRTINDIRGGSVYAYGHEEYTTDSEDGYNDWSTKIATNEGGNDIVLGGLLDDLGWEFCGEMHRRTDLRRFHMADGRSVWDGKSWFCKDATNSTTYDVYNIPDEAMKANIHLKQNPGY